MTGMVEGHGNIGKSHLRTNALQCTTRSGSRKQHHKQSRARTQYKICLLEIGHFIAGENAANAA